MLTLGRHGNRTKDLRRRLRRRPAGQVIVDGCRLVDDLLRWNLPIDELYLTAELAESDRGQRWIARADLAMLVEPAVLTSLAPTRNPQGVVAVTSEPDVAPWDELSGLALLLDTVQDPGNVGAIVRSAAALGAETVLLTPGCADPFHPAAVRGSAGAVLRLPIQANTSLEASVETVTSAGGDSWAADAGGTNLDQWRPAEPCLLVVGSEGAGLGSATRDLVPRTVSVPLARDIESLNVAVAAALLVRRFAEVRSRG